MFVREGIVYAGLCFFDLCVRTMYSWVGLFRFNSTSGLWSVNSEMLAIIY